MKQLFAKVIHIESEEDDRYHVTVTVDVFGDIDQFKLEGIDADPDASPVSDINEGTYSIGFSGPGKPPFKVGDLIPVIDPFMFSGRYTYRPPKWPEDHLGIV